MVVDADNSGTVTSGDVVSGYRTTGFVVYDTPLAAGETDLATRLACGDDFYTAGARGALTSKEGLFVRGLALYDGFEEARNAAIYVCTHRETWEDGTALQSRAGEPVAPPAVDPTGIGRTLVWPAPLLPGSYDIVLDANGDGKYTRGVDLVDATSGETAGVVVSDAGNLVTAKGRVLDPDGKPVAGAVVTCADSGQGSATTEADGSFALAQLLPVPTRLTVVAPGYAPAEQTLSPAATDSQVNVPTVTLQKATASAGGYFPLVDGAEWRYDVDRRIEVTDTTSGSAAVAKTVETGTIVRGLVQGAEDGFSLTEQENVSAEPEGGTLAEYVREAHWSLSQGPDGLAARLDERSGVWMPLGMEVGKEYAAGPFRVGDYTVWGTAKLESGGEVKAAAGTYPSTLVVVLTPQSAIGKSGGEQAAKGAVRIWIAPEVGEVRREADITLDVVSMGNGSSGSITTRLLENLELTSARVQ